MAIDKGFTARGRLPEGAEVLDIALFAGYLAVIATDQGVFVCDLDGDQAIEKLEPIEFIDHRRGNN